MAHIVLISGPPFAAALWDMSASRLRASGHRVETRELFVPAPSSASAPDLADSLHAPPGPGPKVLVAHGLAVPVALHAARNGWTRLVLTNGPLRTRTLAALLLATWTRIPGAWRPSPIQRFLASSAGLRRAVTNPYVMDRDTVVALSDPILRPPDCRAAVATYLRSLAHDPGQPPDPDIPVLLVWGDEDPLHSSGIADQFATTWADAKHVRIRGGQFVHPVERPWAVADNIDSWLSQTLITT
jgi:pimeloyl-ACP methyl ester carboxylesterase